MVDILRSQERRPRIGLFGLGKSNLGVLELLRSSIPCFELTLRSDKPITSDINADRIYTGKSAYAEINEDVLFFSPSVRRDRPELTAAQKRGTVLTSDAELFFSLFGGRVYAVTGSDGKSTTTYLISELLKASGISAVPAGNFGRSLSSLAKSDATVVAELSSFQLQYLTPRSYSAVITNVTPNHLNWHTSIAEYTNAKLNILKNAERVTVDYDSELLREALPKERLFAAVSSERDYGELKKAVDAENYLTVRESTVYLNGSPYFSTLDAIRRESYNVKNYMLAAAATLGAVAPQAVTAILRDFRGLAHRAEQVASSQGFTYINSSIDSTPERTLKTLRALSGKTAVIICGMSKGLALDRLANELPSLTSGAVLMGDIGRGIYAILTDKARDYSFGYAENMRDAIALAESYLPSGGNVVLSPAGTSFDKYENFEMRGEDFRRSVLSHIL